MASILAIYGAMMASMDDNVYDPTGKSYIPPTPEELERLKKKKEYKTIQNKIKQGLKPFHYNEKNADGEYEDIVWALNQKNADRKAKKKGWYVPKRNK